MKTDKIYVLMANGEFYDAHERLATVQKWRDDFSSAVRTGRSPQRWFNRFVIDDKMVKVKFEILEVELDKCKKI